MRVACLLVRDLPLVAELRAHPELAETPLAIAAGPGPRAELVAVSPEAARRGVRCGSSAVQGRAACAELAVRVASPALERAARDALLDVALSASPRAAPASRGGGAWGAEAAVFLDASGVGTLFGSEAGFARALCERARRVGLPAMAMVAASREVARIAARTLVEPGATRVIPPGAEAAFLAPLPVDLLDPDDALAQALTRFGVRRLGELARLPRRALATRLGPGALRLADLARGAADPVPLPPSPLTRLEEAVDLECAVERLEPLAFVLRGMLSRLATRLEVRGLGCGDLELELALEGGGRDARRVGVATPTGDARVLVRLACLALEARPPDAPVEAVSLATEGRPLRRDQLDLFRPAGPAPAVLDRTLAELEALCGDGRVGAPAPVDDHRPDSFRLEPFSPPNGTSLAFGSLRAPASPALASGTPRSESAASAPPRDGIQPRGTSARAQRAESERSAGPRQAGALAVRILRPPVPARVRVRGGRPVWIQSAVASGPVQALAGPWRTSGGWWSPEGHFALDHFDVQTADGSVARLRFDALHHTWSVDALYD